MFFFPSPVLFRQAMTVALPATAFLIATLTVPALSSAFGASPLLADVVYYGGPIYTLTEDFTKPSALNPVHAAVAQVVAVKDGKILFVGARDDARKAGYLDPARVGCLTNLLGSVMLPGFVDGHGHFPVQGAIDLFQVDLNSPPTGTMTSIDDYIAALRRKAETTKPREGEIPWIVGSGYDDTLIKEQRHPTRADLDRVSATLPVVAKHISAHFIVANSKAFALSGVPEDEIPPGGLLDDHNMGLVNIPAPKVSRDEADALMNQAIGRAAKLYAAAGVTTADQGGSLLKPLDHGFTMDDQAVDRLVDKEIAKLGLTDPENVSPVIDEKSRAELTAKLRGTFQTAIEGAASDQVQRWPVDHTGAGHLFEFQQAINNGDLPIRTIIHPLGGDLMGEINRDFLGWQSSGPYDGLPVTNPLGKADIKTDAVKTVGDDLTNYRRAEALPPLPDKRLLMGSWKLFLDGSIQGYSGWLKNPGYYDHGSRHGEEWRGGDWDERAAAMKNLFERYHQNGEPFEVHGNGNMALEAIVSGLEHVVAQSPVTDMRHSVIHAQMTERQHIARLTGHYADLDKSLTLSDPHQRGGTAADPSLRTDELAKKMQNQHIVNNYFINHAYYWGDRHLHTFMGPGRGKNMSPAGWSVAYDQPFALHNDTPVTPISPLRSVQSAVTRRSAPTPTSVPPQPGGTLVSGNGHDLDAEISAPTVESGPHGKFWDYDQRVNILQALHGVTTVPAYQNHLEHLIGSIAPDKLADFVILGKNPFEVAAATPDTLADIPIVATIVGGKVVYGRLPAPCEKND